LCTDVSGIAIWDVPLLACRSLDLAFGSQSSRKTGGAIWET
jgi:hypothetical protein